MRVPARVLRHLTRDRLRELTGNRSHRLILIAVLLAAIAVFVLSTEPWVDPTNRFRIIMGAILGQTLVLYLVLVRMFRQQEELRSQHAAASYVHTLEGLLDALAAGAQTGGIPLETRMAIYAAAKEQLALYRQVLGVDGSPTVMFEKNSDGGLDAVEQPLPS